jgi:hypothetical protein
MLVLLKVTIESFYCVWILIIMFQRIFVLKGVNGNPGMKGGDGEAGQVLLGRKGLPGRPGESGLTGPRGTPGFKVII